MSENNESKRILANMTASEAIFRCGELQLPFDQVAVLLAGRMDAMQLLNDLATPGTDACAWYQSGLAEGNLALAASLEANIDNPKVRDAYKSLSAECRRQANDKLHERFGL